MPIFFWHTSLHPDIVQKTKGEGKFKRIFINFKLAFPSYYHCFYHIAQIVFFYSTTVKVTTNICLTWVTYLPIWSRKFNCWAVSNVALYRWSIFHPSNLTTLFVFCIVIKTNNSSFKYYVLSRCRPLWFSIDSVSVNCITWLRNMVEGCLGKKKEKINVANSYKK